ncbi:hypothetical protein C3F09_05325, partial [candidate division GN15 bacterium]
MKRLQVSEKRLPAFGRVVCRWFSGGVPALMIIWLAGLVSAGPSVFAQTPAPPGVDVLHRQTKEKPKLDRDTRDLADEYAELLINLDDIMFNYNIYLREYSDDVVIKLRPSLEKLRRELDSMKFVHDQQLLADQLSKSAEELKKTELHIRDSKTIYPMRLYRLIQSLRREITSLDDLLQDDILPRLEENDADRQAIQAYVSSVLADALRSSRDERTVRVTVLQDSLAKTIEMARLKVESKKQQMEAKRLESEAKAPGVVVIPPIPDVKVVPPIPPSPWALVGKASGSGLLREFGDTVSSVSPATPIRIANRYGSTEVVGWDDDVITATWTIEVQGSTRQQERAFADSAKLEVRKLPDGYTVAPVFMQPTDRSGRFIQNELVVYVPARSPVTIANTFGEINASGLEAGVQASTNYADAEFTAIKGRIDITCSMGELTVSTCEGPIKLVNSYSPVTVDECVGEMTIANAYAQVTVNDSRGNLTIKNSGSVTVNDHQGNLSIDNSLGPIEVTGLDGDLDATNRYQPIVVRDITGSVKLDGAYSTLDLSNVRGDAQAFNKFGMIKAEGLSGPLILNNENGSTIIALDDLLRGTSRITGSFGNITVSVPQSANLLLLANTNGSINTDLPMQITTGDEKSRGVLKLGRS